MHTTRRQFLASATSVALAATAPRLVLSARADVPSSALSLTIERRTIEVAGKAASIFGLRQPDGCAGISARTGDRLRLRLINRSGEQALIHWHGQTPPMAQDGVPGLSSPPLADGADAAYDFPLRPGTHWMHSHHGLQEQLLMAAPLIVRESDAGDHQDVVVMLHDFSFAPPASLLSALHGEAAAGGHGPHGAMPTNQMGDMMVDHAAHRRQMQEGMAATGSNQPIGHANDIDYDAYLANDRTLDDPQVVRVDKGGRVRLRLINGATATAFGIDTGTLVATVLSVDGNPVTPLGGTRFPLAMGQRIDLAVDIPAEGGAFPILAVREAARERTGIILATGGAAVKRRAPVGTRVGSLLDLSLESRLRAITPLPRRPADRQLKVALGQTGGLYAWTLNGRVHGQDQPLEVRQGERVEMTFHNMSMMMHPMHLHGHHFQVVAINGRPLAGALRDTVIVPAGMATLTVAFDADNPGQWPLHCHNLYHMAAGMMTTVRYI